MHGLGELFPLPQTAPQRPCSASLRPPASSPKQGLPFPSLPRSRGSPDSRSGLGASLLVRSWVAALTQGHLSNPAQHWPVPFSLGSWPGTASWALCVHRSHKVKQVSANTACAGDSRRTCEFTGPAGRLPSARVRGGAAAGHEEQRIKGSGAAGRACGRGPPRCTRPPFGARWAVYGSSVLLTTSSPSHPRLGSQGPTPVTHSCLSWALQRTTSKAAHDQMADAATNTQNKQCAEPGGPGLAAS